MVGRIRKQTLFIEDIGSVRAPDGRWSLVRQSVFSIADDFTAGMANAVGNDLQIRMLPRITS